MEKNRRRWSRVRWHGGGVGRGETQRAQPGTGYGGRGKVWCQVNLPVGGAQHPWVG